MKPANVLGISCQRQRSYYTPPHQGRQRTIVTVGVAATAAVQLHPMVGRHHQSHPYGYGD
jgi:hypothetical protein